MAESQNSSAMNNNEGNKISFVDKASARQKRALAIKPELMILYVEDLNDGKLTDKEINALAETLSYVEDEERVLNVIKDKTPASKALYAWAIANASIAFPYMTLHEAAEKVSTNLELTPEWGHVQNDKIRLPLPNEDREIWYMINALCIKLLNAEVEYLTADPLVPELGNDEIAKNNKIHSVLRRIVELMKSPLSATIRTGDLKGEDMIKNAVDFVVLDSIYRGQQDWENLKVSEYSVRAGRRAVSTSFSEGKGQKKKVSFTTVYVGYKLSDILGEYITVKSAKSPESEPLVRLFLTLINKVIPDTIPLKYEIPKIFFENPSLTVRKCLRQGPKISSKKGLKDNLYAPFSFVKSSECANMPVITRKEATDLSTVVLKTLDQINSLDTSEASTKIGSYKKYLDLSYTLSDTARSQWRKNYTVPKYSEISSILGSCFAAGQEGEKPYLCPALIEEAKSLIPRVTWTRVPQNKAEEDAIKNDITSAANKRRRTGISSSS